MAKPSNVIFRASITLKDGTVLKARDYGIKAFPIRVNGSTGKRQPK